MSDLRGATGSRLATGRRGADSIDVNVLVDKRGRIITVPGPFAQSPSGLVRPRADNNGTQYVTSGLAQVRTAIPGIGPATLYATGDAFGAGFTLGVPIEGTIATVVFRDYDDEGVTKELVLFNDSFTATADNAAFAVSDADLGKCVGVISIATFYNFGNNQIGIVNPALYYLAPRGILYCQLVTRGGDTIAQGAIPDLTIMVV